MSGLAGASTLMSALNRENVMSRDVNPPATDVHASSDRPDGGGRLVIILAGSAGPRSGT
jgi:hypothetical protein